MTVSRGKKDDDRSRIWRKKSGHSSIRREKDERQQPLDEEGCETAASGGKRMTNSSLWTKKDVR